MDRRVEVPMNEVALLELVGLVFDRDTVMILEDNLKFEDGRWTCLDKFDNYFCETIMSLRRNKDGLDIPFK